jgi:tetratricopeptide (TPR) repeat protein
MHHKTIPILIVTLLLGGISPALSHTPATGELLLSQSSNANAFFEQGVQKYNQGDYQSAIVDFDQAIRINPNFAEAFAFRGLALVGARRLEEAIADYTQALRLFPGNNQNIQNIAVVHRNRGNAFTNLGRFQEAISDFTLAIRLNPDYTDAYYQRGFLRSENNQVREAIADFNQVIALDSNHLGAYAQRGLAYSFFLGDQLTATQDFLRVIQLTPRSAEDHWNRGAAYFSLGNYSQAVADFSQAIVSSPGYVRAYSSRASVLYLQGEEQGAIADLQKVLSLSQESPQNDIGFVATLSDILAQYESYEEALELLDAAIAEDPTSSELYFQRGFTRSSQNDQTGAWADFNQAIRLEPNYSRAFYWRSAIRLQRQDFQGALADLNEAIRISPNHTQAYLDRGFARQQLNDSQARSDFEQVFRLSDAVLRLNPNSADSYYTRGIARFQLGDYAGGTTDLERAASLYQQQGYIVAAQQIQESLVSSQPAAAPVSGANESADVAARVDSEYLLQVQGTLSPGGPTLSDGSLFQEHTFEGRTGQTVTITMLSNEFDTYLLLVDANGNTLAENDDFSPTNLSSQITITLPTNGTYRVLANAFDSTGRGQYILTVR